MLGELKPKGPKGCLVPRLEKKPASFLVPFSFLVLNENDDLSPNDYVGSSKNLKDLKERGSPETSFPETLAPGGTGALPTTNPHVTSK